MPDHEFMVQRLSRIGFLVLGSRVLLHIAASCFAFLTDWACFDAGAGVSFFRQNYSPKHRHLSFVKKYFGGI